MVQRTINGGEKGEDEEKFRGNEKVKKRLIGRELSNGKLFLRS
jgi:hypothetical protein